MNTFGTDKATTIRPPSTANLMIDSADRPNILVSSPWDFQITKQQNNQIGYFSRIGTTEVVLEWCTENVNSNLNNTNFSVDISGIGGLNDSELLFDTLDSGMYTVEEALNNLVEKMNTNSIGAVFSLVQVNGETYIDCSGAVFTFGEEKLLDQLDISSGESFPYTNHESQFAVICPDLRPYRYIDFVSPDLTYAQDVKDSSTATNNFDVLCRWYFAEETQESVDGLGFPILMGYRRFCRRRIFNPPKQIKWDKDLPIGNLRFQVFGNDGKLLTFQSYTNNNWLMTLQLSEN